MQLLICPAVDVGNVQSCTHLPNGRIAGPSNHAMASGNSSAPTWQVQWAPYSWPVTSSIIGPMEASASSSQRMALLAMEVVQQYLGMVRPVALTLLQCKFPPLTGIIAVWFYQSVNSIDRGDNHGYKMIYFYELQHFQDWRPSHSMAPSLWWGGRPNQC